MSGVPRLPCIITPPPPPPPPPPTLLVLYKKNTQNNSRHSVAVPPADAARLDKAFIQKSTTILHLKYGSTAFKYTRAFQGPSARSMDFIRTRQQPAKYFNEV
ncbi:unnamed protein product [Boreogadus saida]